MSTSATGPDDRLSRLWDVLWAHLDEFLWPEHLGKEAGLMTARTAARCYADDCYEAIQLVLKLHRRDEPLLSPPGMAACADHVHEVLDEAVELMLAEAECGGLSVLKV